MFRREALAVGTVALAGCLSSEARGPADGTNFEQSAVETVFVDEFNAMREEHGLQQVTQRDPLSEMGQAHAENMAEHDYVGHVQPDGTTIEDRFQNRGLSCRLPTPDSEQFYPAAENAAGAAEGDVTHPNTDKTFYVGTNADLVRFLLSSWMSSPPHRRVMVLPSVAAIGLGVAQDGDDIYAALEFC